MKCVSERACVHVRVCRCVSVSGDACVVCVLYQPGAVRMSVSANVTKMLTMSVYSTFTMFSCICSVHNVCVEARVCVHVCLSHENV